MSVIPLFATTTHADLALAEASKLTGERQQMIRARLIALAALQRSFPRQTARQLATLLNYPAPEAAGAAVRKSRAHSNWWNEDWVDEVNGALVAERYGEQAQ